MLKELLALSTALSASLTAQIDFDSRQMKHCSTYNLAEGVDKDDGKARGIYQMASEEYELAVTPKKTNPFTDVFACFFQCCFWLSILIGMPLMIKPKVPSCIPQ